MLLMCCCRPLLLLFPLVAAAEVATMGVEPVLVAVFAVAASLVVEVEVVVVVE